jgi:hypothetical protein
LLAWRLCELPPPSAFIAVYLKCLHSAKIVPIQARIFKTVGGGGVLNSVTIEYEFSALHSEENHHGNSSTISYSFCLVIIIFWTSDSCRCHENPSTIRKHNLSLCNTIFCLQPLQLLLQLMYLIYSCLNIFLTIFSHSVLKCMAEIAYCKHLLLVLSFFVCFSLTEIRHMWPASSKKWTL